MKSILKEKIEIKNEDVNILIVDDSEFSRGAISNFLTEEGFNVVAAVTDAKSAIEIASTSGVDIAIIDAIMPEISGIELTETLCKNFIRLSVIMISSIAQENVIISSIAAGASDFIQKPFKKEELIDSIMKILERRK